MKTFKQLMEELSKPVTPKQFDVKKSDTMFIRTPDIIKKKTLNLEVNILFQVLFYLQRRRKLRRI